VEKPKQAAHPGHKICIVFIVVCYNNFYIYQQQVAHPFCCDIFTEGKHKDTTLDWTPCHTKRDTECRKKEIRSKHKTASGLFLCCPFSFQMRSNEIKMINKNITDDK
jgi:hypothetical protein